MRRYFDGASTVNVDQMLDPWVDDLVYEEAFSDPPRRIEGKDALRPYFSKAGEVFRMVTRWGAERATALPSISTPVTTSTPVTRSRCSGKNSGSRCC